MDLITFKNVNFFYNKNTRLEKKALNNVSLLFSKNQFHAIIGQTGSGKSTLMQHLNCLLLPDEGQIIIDGFKIDGQKVKKQDVLKIRKNISLLFQFSEKQLFAENVESDIIFGPINFGVEVNEAKKIARKVIKLVGLDESYLKRSPFNLSGGEKRRVALAGVLAINPQVLILDEPTIGLDFNGQKNIMNIISGFLKDNKTIILITHNMQNVWDYSQITTLINEGKIIVQSKSEKFFNNQEIFKQYNLNLPKIKYVIEALKKRNYSFKENIKTLPKLIEAIKLQKEKSK